MRRLISSLVLIYTLFIWGMPPARPYTVQYTDASATVQLKWPVTRITVTLSTSLDSPPSNIKAGSDVIGAARRAMARWAAVANIQLVENTNAQQRQTQSISPNNSGGDGINLITVANTPDNQLAFPNCSSGTADVTGRTRVFYDPANGNITEADIAINPCVQFSTDGTTGTYDLESTFTHELGHFLGLEHSAILGATMAPIQALNGAYGVAQTTVRTLSSDDRAGARSIYGAPPASNPQNLNGILTGTVTNAAGQPVFGAHVWLEVASTGRVVAGNITLQNGKYTIGGLPAAQYRVRVEGLDGPIPASFIPSSNGAYGGLQALGNTRFVTTEVPGEIAIPAAKTTQLNITLASGTPTLNPRILGINAQLSTTVVPLVAGQTYTLYIGGEGIEQVPCSNISITSPYFTVNPVSCTPPQPAAGTNYITVSVAVNQFPPAGDYTIRLQSNSGEVGVIVGGLAVEQADISNTQPANSIDQTRFFVHQQYQDFLFREPESGGFNDWSNYIDSCNGDATCIQNHRVETSADFFRSHEFFDSGFFVWRMYRATLVPNRSPTYAEFSRDAPQVHYGVNGDQTASSQLAFAQNWVQRPDFQATYGGDTTTAAFIDHLAQVAGVTLTSDERNQLLTQSRPQIVVYIVNHQEVTTREFNPAFVAMQYFGYLKRDPEAGGYNAWLGYLNSHPTDYATMVYGFAYSAEYRARFGQP